MRTFEELYCRKWQCPPEQFRRRVFRSALPWHPRVISVLLGGFHGRFFAPDRILIGGVAEAQSLEAIAEEIRDFFMDPANQTFVRKSCRLRISTKRLKAIAIDCGVPKLGRSKR